MQLAMEAARKLTIAEASDDTCCSFQQQNPKALRYAIFCFPVCSRSVFTHSVECSFGLFVWSGMITVLLRQSFAQAGFGFRARDLRPVLVLGPGI